MENLSHSAKRSTVHDNKLRCDSLVMALLLEGPFLQYIAEQILQYTKGCPCKTLFLKLAKNNL